MSAEVPPAPAPAPQPPPPPVVDSPPPRPSQLPPPEEIPHAEPPRTSESTPRHSASDPAKPGAPPPATKPTQLSTRLASKKMIDILTPKKEPLPVFLPPIGEVRRQNFVPSTPPPASGPSLTNVPSSEKGMKSGSVPFVDGDDAPNPFQYPASIKEFMAKRDAEKAEAKKKIAETPALMKGTSLFKQNQTVLARIKPFLQPTFKPSLAHDYKQVIWRAQNGLHINHLQKVSRKLHTEYIMQRKNIYYLRRAIRSRKIALEMIGKTREFEEACLKDYEWLTDFTKEAFETFLKENDEKTHQAALTAEHALKEKLDKALQVRQLSIQINQVKSDIIQTNESLRECKTYMRFLDDIAREIMRKDEEEEIRAQHREQQVKEELMIYLKQGMSLKKAQQTVEERAKELYEDYFSSGQHRASFGNAASSEFLSTLHKEVRRYLGMPEEVIPVSDEPEEVEQQLRRGSIDDDVDDDSTLPSLSQEPLKETGFLSPRTIVSSLVQRNKSRLIHVVEKQERKAFEKLMMGPGTKKILKNAEDEDGFNEFALLKSLELVPGDEDTDRRELAGLSFTRPSQLLQIYSDMEEANLSLIQHSQASEEMLERVNNQITNTRKNLNHRGRLLRDEINRMQANIDGNEDRANALAMLVEMFTGGNYDVRQQQKLYKILQKHVARVYRAAVGTIDHHLNPIMMLTSIEKNFEDLMYEIQAMPTDVVMQISRELDKERREMERLEKMNHRKKIQEERKSRQLDRAKAPIHRRKGRPLLPRSHPPKVIIHLSQEELDKKAEADEFNYFFGP